MIKLEDIKVGSILKYKDNLGYTYYLVTKITDVFIYTREVHVYNCSIGVEDLALIVIEQYEKYYADNILDIVDMNTVLEDYLRLI